MKINILSLTILLITTVILNAQNAISPAIGYSYLNDSKIGGLHFGTEMDFFEKENILSIGFDFVNASGNRNFNPGSNENYNIETDNHFVPYSPIQGNGLQYNYPLELNAKTSKTIEITISLMYKKELDFGNNEIKFKGGIFASYVNKFYLVGPYLKEVEIFLSPNNSYKELIDLYLPFNSRYIAYGLKAGINYSNSKILKNKIGLYLNTNYLGGNNFSIYSGIYYKITNNSANN